MDSSGQKLLNLMFRAGETVCVSNSQFGYHSIPLEEALSSKEITLVPTQESCIKRNIEYKIENFDKKHTDEMILVALNPISGFRLDSNCVNYRNFLLEIDIGPIDEQIKYLKSMGVPYSAMVFSGNKSIHTLISLSENLPSEDTYRIMAEWALNIVTLCDPNTKNPSRSIRIPGAYREPGKKQELIELVGHVSLAEFGNWLKKYPEAKPKKQKKLIPSDSPPEFGKLKPWVIKVLKDGTVGEKAGRNIGWYQVACEFFLSNYGFDDTIEVLSQYFVPDRDFKDREWKTSIKSAYKNVNKRK